MKDSGCGDDSREIEAVMQVYIDGGRSGSAETLSRILHPLATVCGHVDPDLFAGPIQMFYDRYADCGPTAGLTAGDLRVDVEGTVASARIEGDIATVHRFTDFCTPVKIDEHWKNFSKVFCRHPE